MNVCIGIISWFPDEIEIRDVRYNRIKELIRRCKINMPGVKIFIIAQNWKDIDIDDATVLKYDKLGITGARKELMNVFIKNTSYDYIVCFDDDFELNIAPKSFSKYLLILNSQQNKLIEYENYLMNMCAVSRYIASKYPFDEKISAELGTGFEDWIWISMIRKKDQAHYLKLPNMGLVSKPRKALVEDKYSTWINKDTNKDDLTEKSKKIIDSI